MTVTEALAAGTRRLAAARIPTPHLDAALLLAEILHTDKAGIIIHGPETVPEDVFLRFQQLLGRRLAGESSAYILGKKEFFGLEFTVGPGVLVPRPETEILVEAALDLLSADYAALPLPCSVLDLCTGSGAVAIALKHKMPELEVWAADISGAALEIAVFNAARLLPGRTIHFLQGDLFDKPKKFPPPLFTDYSSLPASRYSLIVSNPPYVDSAEIETLAMEVRREPRLALDGGKDGLDLIRRVISEAPGHLEIPGWIVLEADPRQMDSIIGILGNNGFSGIKVYKDLSGQPRVIEGKIPAEPKKK
jgi:release factor glutamine methyltransferase